MVDINVSQEASEGFFERHEDAQEHSMEPNHCRECPAPCVVIPAPNDGLGSHGEGNLHSTCYELKGGALDAVQGPEKEKIPSNSNVESHAFPLLPQLPSSQTEFPSMSGITWCRQRAPKSSPPPLRKLPRKVYHTQGLSPSLSSSSLSSCSCPSPKQARQGTLFQVQEAACSPVNTKRAQKWVTVDQLSATAADIPVHVLVSSVAGRRRKVGGDTWWQRVSRCLQRFLKPDVTHHELLKE